MQSIAGARKCADAPSVEELRARAELVLDIKARTSLINDEARKRTVDRRIDALERLLPILRKALTAVAGVTALAVVLLSMDQAQYDELVRRVLASGPIPYSAAAALGVGGYTLKTLRKRGSAAVDRGEDSDEPPPNRA